MSEDTEKEDEPTADQRIPAPGSGPVRQLSSGRRFAGRSGSSYSPETECRARPGVPGGCRGESSASRGVVASRRGAAGMSSPVPAERHEPAELGRLLQQLVVAIEESPVPSHEWRSLERLFGAERLANLLGISPASVRRCQAGSRETPDTIAARLHFWRPWSVTWRAPTTRSVSADGSSARDLFSTAKRRPIPLQGEWDPESPKVRRVRELARSLGAPAAT